MSRSKRLLMSAILMWCMAVSAMAVDGVIVTSGDTHQGFPLSDVKELTFADTGVTVVMTDNTTTVFDGAWTITFGDVDASGIATPEVADTDAPAMVYGLDGRLVTSLTKLSDLQKSDLAPSMYIVRVNGKSIKIKR